jgi:hypothetical protein
MTKQICYPCWLASDEDVAYEFMNDNEVRECEVCCSEYQYEKQDRVRESNGGIGFLNSAVINRARRLS